MRGAALVVVVVALTGVGRADPIDDALREVVGEAAIVVRGSAVEASTRRDAFTYTRFAVSETLRGRIDGSPITVRQPAGGEDYIAQLERGADMILLLDPRESDGSYPIHGYPLGRYRVQRGDTGDQVVLDATGIDSQFVSPKDRRPSMPAEPVPIEYFRSVALGSDAPAAPAVAVSPQPHAAPPAAPVAPAQGETSARKADEPAARWPWLVALLGVAAVAIFFARRR
jgi:hypothetical protein